MCMLSHTSGVVVNPGISTFPYYISPKCIDMYPYPVVYRGYVYARSHYWGIMPLCLRHNG